VGSLDDTAARWIATHRWPPLNDPMVWLGDADRIGAVWVVLALVVTLLQRSTLARVVTVCALTALTVLAADSASSLVKDLTNRPRPFEAHPEIHPLYTVHSSSFPAGHAATAFAGAILLSLLAPRAAPAFVALAALIACSRVYVGVHYPTDVLAGAAIGALVGIAAFALLRRAPRPIAVLAGRRPGGRTA
jgi:undecaprenyl-diphosphatase